MSRGRILTQYVQFLREEKKYWLLPIVAFIVIAMLMAIAQSSALAPFIYTLF
jgi:uncharacterized protein DUF5989